jgi:hypothetical protein
MSTRRLSRMTTPDGGVEHADGQWTAWCPAVTVHATTAKALRAAIEQAITGNHHS